MPCVRRAPLHSKSHVRARCVDHSGSAPSAGRGRGVGVRRRASQHAPPCRLVESVPAVERRPLLGARREGSRLAAAHVRPADDVGAALLLGAAEAHLALRDGRAADAAARAARLRALGAHHPRGRRVGSPALVIERVVAVRVVVRRSSSRGGGARLPVLLRRAIGRALALLAPARAGRRRGALELGGERRVGLRLQPGG